MYDNQFIRFAKAIDPKECCVQLPIVMDGSGIAFYAPANEKTGVVFTIVDASGVPFLHNNMELTGSYVNMKDNYVQNMFANDVPDILYQQGHALFKARELRDYVAPNECFRIRMGVPTDESVQWNVKKYPNGEITDFNAAVNGKFTAETIAERSESVVNIVDVLPTEGVEDALYEKDGVLYKYNTAFKVWKTLTNNVVDDMMYVNDMNDLLHVQHVTTDTNTLVLVKNGEQSTTLTSVWVSGLLARGGSFAQTAGRVICKHIGVPYSLSVYKTMMENIARNGGATFNMTSSDITALRIDGIAHTVGNSVPKYVFDVYVQRVASDGSIALYAENEWYAVDMARDYWYSNLLCACENDDKQLSLLSYECGTETFGIPFVKGKPIRQWLPILLDNPKPTQNEEIYEKLSGERVVMFATINKEYEAETDYIPYDWHERIVIALSCDEVKVNAERLTKSDKYDVDWQNITKTDCGLKLMRATWKMVANVTSRNTND
jgi:hypothetical protein